MNKKKSLRILYGFAIGSAIGAAISLLIAPNSGEVTRHKIKDNVVEVKEKAKEAYTDAREYIIEAVDNAQVKTQSLVEGLSQKVPGLTAKNKDIATG